MWIQKREFQSKCVDLRVVEGVIIMGKAIKAEVEVRMKKLGNDKATGKAYTRNDKESGRVGDILGLEIVKYWFLRLMKYFCC